jgi:3-dehydroquinate synthase
MTPKKFVLKAGTKRCPIAIGDFKEHLGSFTRDRKCLYLTDQNVYQYYHSVIPKESCIIMEAGEQSKTLENLTNVFRSLLSMSADRSTMLIGIGGGVVTDIAGFVASTFMRGIDFGFVSTSVLGQVDAVIGGKNGVNLDGYKNMIGTFNQPSFIISDPVFFKTLPDEEYINGMAEVLKQFLIADAEGLKWFDQHIPSILNKDQEILAELIYRQSRIKARIVEQDETEKGLRKILNFGHTFGHAIEKEEKWPHGHAVAAGMSVAIELSRKEGLICRDDAHYCRQLIGKIGLPKRAPNSPTKYFESLKRDKKKRGESVDFILLKNIGEAMIRTYPFEELEDKTRNLNS